MSSVIKPRLDSNIFVQVSQVCYVFYPHEVACHFLFLGLSLALPTAKRADEAEVDGF